jgi:hypothetical protein
MSRFALFACLVLFASDALASEHLRFGGDNAKQPQLAAGPDGTIHCVFGAGQNIYCATSRDAASSFAEPVLVAKHDGLMLGMRRGPRVAVAHDAVVVSAISSDDGNLVARHSKDGGHTWSEPARINTVARSCREGLHDMTSAPDGTLAAVWLDLRNDKTELWASFSNDHGATWSENRRIYRSPGGNICECCHPTLVAAEGGWLALWRNSLEGSRDMYALPLALDGSPTEPAMRLGGAHWKLAACPMDGGDVATNEKGGAWAVWRREKTCYATNMKASEKRERRLGNGEQPVVAVTREGPAFAWITKRRGDLLVLGPDEAQPTRIATPATDPSMIATAGGQIVLAWEGEGGVIVASPAR